MSSSCMKCVQEEVPQGRRHFEVADIFREHGDAYRRAHPLPKSHLEVMHLIEICRTAYLGGRIEECDTCGHQREVFRSCRNRHCPKCQALTKAKWLESRMLELLPVSYFHNVFTLPHELNRLALCNKKVVLTILFKSVSETLTQFGSNPKNGLGGKLGFISILHTWDQTIRDHFHLHTVIPGGALSFDGSQWIASKEEFLFHVKALSRVFRGKFIDFLEGAFHDRELIFPGSIEPYGTEDGFTHLTDQLWAKEWAVFSKRPFAGAEQVLEYLSRYTHRVAISNERIIGFESGKVSFKYRDRKDNDTIKVMTLEAEEFIRRFLLHILPQGFMRIRYYGFLANRCKKENTRRIRELLDIPPEPAEKTDKTTQELILELTGIDVTKCPNCKRGTMKVIKELSRPLPFNSKGFRSRPTIQDSS